MQSYLQALISLSSYARCRWLCTCEGRLQATKQGADAVNTNLRLPSGLSVDLRDAQNYIHLYQPVLCATQSGNKV